MDGNSALIVFQDRKIRRVWHNEEWWFVLEDIVLVLTDTVNVKDYINKMRLRDEELNKGYGQIVHILKVGTGGGEQGMNCANTEGVFRIIQSIPSKKAEPFKLWLAKVGYERIKEIENPELAQERMKQIYEQKGYPKEWIDKRLRGIAIRQDLTDEWKQREINKNLEYAILTNEISKATFGKTVEEYKKYKKLKGENLRDHMSDLELIFSMLGEKVTIEITKNENAKGFGECKETAKRGGNVAGNARKETEKEIGKPIVSNENFLPEEKRGILAEK